MLVRFLGSCSHVGLMSRMLMCLKKSPPQAEAVGWVDICVSSDSRHQASTTS